MTTDAAYTFPMLFYWYCFACQIRETDKDVFYQNSNHYIGKGRTRPGDIPYCTACYQPLVRVFIDGLPPRPPDMPTTHYNPADDPPKRKHRTQPKFTPAQVGAMRRTYVAGATYQDLAAQWGCGTTVVRQAVTGDGAYRKPEYRDAINVLREK